MREIIFRGKTFDNEWIYGFLILDRAEHNQPRIDYYREYSTGTFYHCQAPRVHISSVGQFTGLKDKNGKKIFEGDIVKYTRKNMYAPETSFHKQDIVSIHKIYWDNSNFRFSQEHYDLESKRCIGGGNITFTDWRAKEEEIEVIGNIHEHKGFLEVGDGK